MSTPDGGPAFPVTLTYEREGKPPEVETYSGMTLRDWFAGQALGGIAAVSYQLAADASAEVRGLHPAIAESAYEVADAMLAERDR